jgi:L-ascorbate 6-phosphate lactonase
VSELSDRIEETRVEKGSLAIFWLGQAGFVYKTPGGSVIYVDPYLSDCVSRMVGEMFFGFKRIMPSPVLPEDVKADWLVCTHSHPDHYDFDAVPVIAKNPDVKFAGAPDCLEEFQKLNLKQDRYKIIQVGKRLDCGDFSLTGVYADHGELAPDALGVVIEIGDIKVWQVGDTAYRPEKWQEVFDMKIDVLVPPINGAFGNLNGAEAANLARDCGANLTIPCHFWMFAEHGGSPLEFLEACKESAPDTEARLMSQGELIIFRK